MKTKELIKRVEELGYDVELYPSHVVIKTSNISVATVHTQRLYEINTRSIVKVELTHKEELFDLIIKYAKTPIDERDEPKKYYLRHRWLGARNEEVYLGFAPFPRLFFLHSTPGNIEGVRTKFSLEAIEHIKEDFDTDLGDYEIVEVEE